MNPKQISQDDLILFALQDLTPEEAAEVLVHLEHSETAREELAQIQGDLAMYALTSELQTPPPQARERLLRGVAKEKKLAPVARATTTDEPLLLPREDRAFTRRVEPEPQRSGMGFLGWAGWAVAACSIAAAGFEFYQQQPLRDTLNAQNKKLAEATDQAERAHAVMTMLSGGGAMQVTLHQPATSGEPPKPEGHAAYVADTGSLVFIGMHLKPLQPYKTYQLWVIPPEGSDPIPAGVFKPDQQGFASVILPPLPKGITAKTFGVTIEDDGGSKTPTSPIVLAGK
jgi:hypothetical protein